MATLNDILGHAQATGMLPKIDPVAAVKPAAPVMPGTGGPPPTTTGAPPPTAGQGQIPYWGMYMNQAMIDPSQVNNNPYASQFLSGLQRYDPNASFQFNQDPNGGVGSYSLQYDQSKLPAIPGSDQNAGDYAGMYWRPQDATTFAQNQANPMYGGDNRLSLYSNDPRAFTTDPTYGRTTPFANGKPDPGTWLDWAGPMIVGGIGTLLSGGALSPLMQALLHAPQTADSISNGASPLAGVLSLAGGATGIPGGGAVGSFAGNMIDPMKQPTPGGG